MGHKRRCKCHMPHLRNPPARSIARDGRKNRIPSCPHGNNSTKSPPVPHGKPMLKAARPCGIMEMPVECRPIPFNHRTSTSQWRDMIHSWKLGSMRSIRPCRGLSGLLPSHVLFSSFSSLICPRGFPCALIARPPAWGQSRRAVRRIRRHRADCPACRSHSSAGTIATTETAHVQLEKEVSLARHRMHQTGTRYHGGED